MIKCSANGRYYIGGTTLSFDLRFARHRSQLRRGKCGVRLLQACHDLHGMESLEFIPLKAFPPDDVAAREREAIEALKPDLNVYGVRPRSGAAAPFFDRSTRYDVGGRQLTVAQIASEAGLCERAIEARILRGMTGASLVAGKHKAPRKAYVRKR